MNYSVVFASGTEVVDSETYARAAGHWGLVVAPRKFSEVAKVRFYIAIRNRNASVDIDDASLRIWVNSINNDPLDPTIRTISPGSSVQGSDVAAPGANGFFTSTIGDRHFTRRGDPVKVLSNATSNSSQVLTVEFDVFSATDADFFTAWNRPGTEDEHIQFQLSFSFSSGPSTADMDLTTFGMTVVQAPSPQNDTVTYRRVWPGRQENASGITVFDSANPTVHNQIRGAWRWRYNAADWDGLSSIHLMTMWGNKNNSAGITIEVHELTSETQAGGSSTMVSSDTIDTSADTQDAGCHRTQDLLPFMEDGKEYVVNWRHEGAAAAGGPSAAVDMQLEIVQKDCSKTITYFEAGTGESQGLNGFSGVPPQINQFVGYIDPRFFANYPDDLFFRRQLSGGIVHDTAANDAEFEMLMNPNLEEDQNGPGGVTPTTQSIAFLTDTPSASAPRWTYQELDIGVNSDPIALAGARKLIARYAGTSWTAGNDEHPGQISLLYAFAVPNTEILELGPVFPVGEFNPEGCAATSAGLGDPGVLVITNGSTIPKKFDPVAGKIEDAGIPLPFEGELPQTAVENAAFSPDGGIVPGRYEYRYTFRNCCTNRESDPNPDTFVIDSALAGASPAARHLISFVGVRIPADPQICEICLYRTVAGGAFPIMAKVGCFDPDVTTLFVDEVPDSLLDFAADPLSLLNAPMPCVPVVVGYRNRLFGVGDIPQLAPAGTVSVVNGSNIVTGDGSVQWDRCLEGKFFQATGDCRAYEIERILPPVEGISPAIGRLKLVEEYEGQSDTGLTYTICGHKNRLFFSEPLEPEYWPNINFLDVEPGDGDKLIGGVSNFDSLVICKRNKTYVLRFRENPLLEVNIPTRISTDIGCIGPRSFAQFENGSIWLSDRGIALYDGRGVHHIEESDRFNAFLVNPDNPNYVRRDGQGRVIDAVGVFYPRREQYLLLLPTVKTTRGASLMLVWDTSLRNITLFEFCQEFQAMVVAKDADGNQRVYLGDTSGFVWMFDVGNTDGVGFPGATGTIRGTVSDAGFENGASFLADEGASFITGGLPQLATLSGAQGLTPAFGVSPNESGELGIAGACVFTRAADAALDDPWTRRTIFAATETQLFVSPGWTAEDLPREGFDYMIGAIEFEATFKPTNMGTDDAFKRNWRHVVTNIPEQVSSKLRVQIKTDLSPVDSDELTVLTEGETGQGRVFDMQAAQGRFGRPVGRRIHNFVQISMKNFAPDEPIRVLNHTLLSNPRTQ